LTDSINGASTAYVGFSTSQAGALAVKQITTSGFQIATFSVLDKTPPAVTITSPATGQRWSNSVFTVSGKTSDNVGVAAVYYQVNGQGWKPASTTDNWADWSSTVALLPGTNLIQAYSVDTSANNSPVAAATIDYVVMDQLEISANGACTISPNYSNAWLEIGRNYSVSATPGSGFTFTNWVVLTNGLTKAQTNGSTLQFTMVSNLTLQVNFKDVSNPTLSILSPTSGQQLPSALATVVGSAGDNWKLRGVWYQLNGGLWAVAGTTNAWTNWTTTVELVSGTNTLLAVAQDLGGNYSITKTLTMVSSNTFNLQLAFDATQPFSTSGPNLVLHASPGLNGHIQVSTNLLDWVSLTNFQAASSLLHFRDPGATNYNGRFYRAVIP
jgi:hypothetical protein